MNISKAISHPIFWGSLALFLAVPTLGDEGFDEEIVVEATRLQQNIYETGSSVYVIESNEIEAMGYQFLVDAIARAPGVTINQNGGFGGSASVRIRGASSDQTLVLVDGVPVNDASSPGGGFNFARLDPASVERIEILSGPQSTLWGSDAIGGVISITTKEPTENISADAFAEYGSANTARVGGALSAANDIGDFRIAVTRVDSDGDSKADENNGNSEEDGYESTTVSLRGGVNLPGASVLDLSVSHTKAEAEFDSFSFGAEGNVGDGDELSETKELSGQLKLTVPALEGKLINTLFLGHSEIERDNFTNGTPSFGAEGDRQLYRYNARIRANERHQFVIGLEREETESGSNDTSIDSLYGLYEVKPLDDLTVTLGLRSDDVEDGETEITSRVALAYQASDALTLRSSWGEGFKAPTLFQTTFFCCGAVAPNADLKAEESEAFDIGLDWRGNSGKTRASLTYFDQDTTNQIDFSFAVGGYENIAVVESRGVEASLSHRLTDSVTVTLDYAYVDAEDGNGNALNRIPKHTGDLTVSYQVTERWSLLGLVRYNDKEPDSNGTVDSWVRGDLSTQYLLSDKVTLFARIENIGDVEYQQILGYGTSDRSFTLGVRTHF